MGLGVLSWGLSGAVCGHHTISPNAGISETSAIPNDDLVAHRATIEALPQVCTPA